MNKEINLVSDFVTFSFQRSLPTVAVYLVQVSHRKALGQPFYSESIIVIQMLENILAPGLSFHHQKILKCVKIIFSISLKR